MVRQHIALVFVLVALLAVVGAAGLNIGGLPHQDSPLAPSRVQATRSLAPSAAPDAERPSGLDSPNQDDLVLLWEEPLLAGYWDFLMLPDGMGGAYVAWSSGTGNVPSEYPPYEGRTYAQRYDPNGNRYWIHVPGLWGTDDLLLSDSGRRESVTALLDDGTGGAMVVWTVDDGFDGTYADVRAQRLSPAGQQLWQVGGVPVVSSVAYLDWGGAVPDGQGGILVIWSRCEDPNTAAQCQVFAQRIQANGTRAWAAAGVPLSFVLDNKELWICWVQSDHEGGSYVVWKEERAGDVLAKVQHVDQDGQTRWTGDAHDFPLCFDAGAQVDGSKVIALDSHPGHEIELFGFNLDSGTTDWGPVVVETDSSWETGRLWPDGTGGAFASWIGEAEASSPYFWEARVQHVSSQGQLSWSQPAPLGAGYGLAPVVVPDDHGGAYTAWTGEPLTTDHYGLRVQHLDPQGQVLWFEGGALVRPETNSPRLEPDGAGGGLLAWTEGPDYGWIGHEQDYPFYLQRGFTDSVALPDYSLQSSSPSFLPSDVFTAGHTLLLYTVPGGAAQGPHVPADLYLVLDGDTDSPVKMDNDGAGQASRDGADLIGSDDHHSLWFMPTWTSTHELTLYAVPAGLPFSADHPMDSLQLAPNPNPELVVLTDLRELFDEFNLTDSDSASSDRNLNGSRDFYDSVARVRQYAADHEGVVMDVRQDAYAQDYAYGASTATRQSMGRDIDRRLIALLKPFRATLENLAIIGDDAVLPFFRLSDPQADLTYWDEARYVTHSWGNRDHGVATLLDSRAKQLMTDVPYSTWSAATPQAPKADLALGRIFATRPLSLTEMIAGYEQPVVIGAQTGSAFVFSRANEYKVGLGESGLVRKLVADWQASTQNNVITMLRAHGYVYRTTLLTDRGKPHWLGWMDAQAGSKWWAWNVRYVMDRAGGNRLTVLFSHAVHVFNQTPFIKASPPDRFWVEHLYKLPPFPGSVLVNYGCHGGYSTGYDATRTTLKHWASPSSAPAALSPAGLRGPWVIVGTEDWNYYYHALARAALERHLTYHSNTVGGAWDNTGETVRYHDRIHQGFIRSLLALSETTGSARRAAQLAYTTYHKADEFKPDDVSALYGTELYGLPTQPVQRTATAVTVGRGGEPAQTAPAPAVQSTAALTISLAVPEFRVTSDEEGYTSFEVPHGGEWTALGNGPYVPLLVRSVHLPAGTTGLTVTLVSSTTAIYPEAVELPPQRVGSRTHGSVTLPFTDTAPYPATPFWTTVYTGTDGVNLFISAMPLQWDPTPGQATLYHHMDFRVEHNPPPAGVQIGTLVLNHGAAVTIDQPLIPISMALTAGDESPLTLRWLIEDPGGLPLRSGAGPFTPTVGANTVEWNTDSQGWPPGPKVLHVMLEDESEAIVATAQVDLVVLGRSLILSTDRGIYGASHAQATVRAEVRDGTGAKVSGLVGSFAQELDGAVLALTWHEGEIYTATLDLTAVPTGSHDLMVTLSSGPAAVTAFGVDRDPPTSTVSLWAHHGPSFTLSLGWWDEISSDGIITVEHRIQEAESGAWVGNWTTWLTRSTGWDYENDAPFDFWPTFGPTQPVPVDTLTYHYCFRTRALDALGNQEAEHDQADLCVGPLQVYLPLVTKEHAP